MDAMMYLIIGGLLGVGATFFVTLGTIKLKRQEEAISLSVLPLIEITHLPNNDTKVQDVVI